MFCLKDKFQSSSLLLNSMLNGANQWLPIVKLSFSNRCTYISPPKWDLLFKQIKQTGSSVLVIQGVHKIALVKSRMLDARWHHWNQTEDILCPKCPLKPAGLFTALNPSKGSESPTVRKHVSPMSPD